MSYLLSQVKRKKRWTMHRRFDLKIREQFTVSAFSLTIWQTSLINVYWNKYGLIQTDATNDIVVYSFLAWLITEFIMMHSVHLPFQCSKVYRLHINYHMTKKNQNNSFNFRFQIGNSRQSKRLLANLRRILLFHYFFFDKNRNTGFSSRYLLCLQKCCMNSRFRTGIFWIQLYRFDFAFILVI